MKKLSECETFVKPENRITLEYASKDKESGDDVYMTHSQIMVTDFDKVKDEYTKIFKLNNHPASNDALYIKSDSESVFIEFKNGDINKFNIRKKIYDSVLIFTDLVDCTISDTREHMEYILVYNSDKNSDPKTKYLESKNRDDIGKILLGYGRKELIKFGLEMFEGYCFKEVHTYNKEEFEQEFVNKIQEDVSC